MNESLKTQLILAAKAGKLTEEQYQIYLQLLKEDPEFREQVEWEDFAEDLLPISVHAGLYEAADQRVFAKRPGIFQQYGYAVAASISVLLLTGLAVFYFLIRKADPVLIGSRAIDLYSSDDRPEGQLGYTSGDIPAGELTLKWWQAKDQKDMLTYRFCNDTLQIYFKEPADTILFNYTYELSYSVASKTYLLESKDGNKIKLETCTDQPKPLQNK